MVLLVAAMDRRRGLYCLAAVLVAAGCAPTALVHEWKSPGYTGRPFDRVLVLTASTDPEVRRVYEDAFVQELAAVGVTAMAAHAVIEGQGEVSEQQIQEAVGEVNANAVLVTRMIGRQHKTSSYVPPPLRDGEAPELYSVYAAGRTLQAPLEASRYELYTLETSLWNAQDRSLVGFNTSQTFQSERALAAAKELADLAVKALRQQKLL
jgi:hypothetical protein